MSNVTLVGTPTAAASQTGSNTPSVLGTWGTGQAAANAAGHLLIALVTNWGGTTGGTPTTVTSGWSQFLTFTDASGRSVVSVWTKIAVGSDTAPTFTATNTGTATFSTLAVELIDAVGQDGATPIPTSGTAGGTTANPLVVTTIGSVPQNQPGCIALSLWQITISGTAASTLAPSGAWTNLSNNNATVTRAHYAFDQLLSVPTSSTLSESEAYTGTGAFTAGAVIILQPAFQVTQNPRRSSTRVQRRAFQSGGSAVPILGDAADDQIPSPLRARVPRPRPVRRSVMFVPAPVVTVVAKPPPQADRVTRPAMRQLRRGSATPIPGGIGAVFQPFPANALRRPWKLRVRRSMYAESLPSSAAPPPALPDVRRKLHRYRQQRGTPLPIPGGQGVVFQPLPALSLYRRIFRYRKPDVSAVPSPVPNLTAPVQPRTRSWRNRKPDYNVVVPPSPPVVTPAISAPYEPRNRILRWKLHRGNVHQLPGPTTTPSGAVSAPFAPTRVRIRWYRRRSNAAGVPSGGISVPVATTVPDTKRVRRLVLLRRIRSAQIPPQPAPEAMSNPSRNRGTPRPTGRIRRGGTGQLGLPSRGVPQQPLVERRIPPRRRPPVQRVPTIVKPPTLPPTIIRRLAQRLWRKLRYKRAAEAPVPAPQFGAPPEDIGCTITIGYLTGTVAVFGYDASVKVSSAAVGSIGPNRYDVTITVKEG